MDCADSRGRWNDGRGYSRVKVKVVLNLLRRQADEN